MAVDRMEVRRMYGQALRADGFRTLEVDGLTDLRELLSRDPTDILIIGRRFGGGDTLDGVSDFRGDHPGLRFLVLGGPADALDAAPVLDAGVDDYVVETAHPDELLARVRAILRRSPERPLITVLGPVVIDLGRHEVSRDGEPVRLSRLDWLILERLAARLGEGVSDEEILRSAKGVEAMTLDPDVVHTWIGRLRSKLGARPGQPGWIRRMPWAGYALDEGSALPPSPRAD